MSFLRMFKGIRLPRPPEPGPAQAMPAPERVYLPLLQHRGEPCLPTVEPGEEVALGQVVGASENFDCATVHASVSGVVEALSQVPDPAGQPVEAVVIKSDGQDTPFQYGENLPAVLPDRGQVLKTRPSRLLRTMREAGLVKATALGLPMHVELSPPMAPRSYMFMTGIPVVRPVDTMIIRAVDQDPPVCPNQAALAELDPAVEMGIAALARIAGAQKVIIVLPAGVDAPEMQAMAQANDWHITHVAARNYPSASDSLLVNALTGREVPTPYGEPRDVGVLVEPLLTALDAGTVLSTGRPVSERVFSVAGDVGSPGAFKVRLGTPIGEVIAAAGGFAGEPGKVVLGGPMLGYAHFSLETPVTKETVGLYVQSAEHLRTYRNQACIHCGRCVQACPVGLIPAELSKLCEFGQFDQAANSDLFHCIECGCCAYVCPARRSMVHFLRHGKSEVLAKRMEQ